MIHAATLLSCWNEPLETVMAWPALMASLIRSVGPEIMIWIFHAFPASDSCRLSCQVAILLLSLWVPWVCTGCHGVLSMPLWDVQVPEDLAAGSLPCGIVLCTFFLVLVHVVANLGQSVSTVLHLVLEKNHFWVSILDLFHYPIGTGIDCHMHRDKDCCSVLCQNVHLVWVGFGVVGHLYWLVFLVGLYQWNFCNASPVAMQISER